MKFENSYYMTDDMTKEYVNAILCRKIRILGSAVSAASILMCIFVAVTSQNPIGLGIYGTCFVVSFAAMFLSPPLMRRELKETERRLHNGKKCQTTVTFYDDSIQMSEGTVSMTFTYDQIQKVRRLKQSIVLMIGKNNAILLKPDGFKTGNEDEFLSFIERKVTVR